MTDLGIMNQLRLAAALYLLPMLLSAQSSLPETPVVFYGIVDSGSTSSSPTSMSWSIEGNGENVSVSDFQLVSVEGQTFYIVRISFESRTVVGATPLDATPNTLALTSADTTYIRSVTIDSEQVTLPAGKGTFIYGFPSQGLVERLDLLTGPASETYAEWSQRLFGELVPQGGDFDKDGKTNYEEYVAGTDPKDNQSRLMLNFLMPNGTGGYTLNWDTVAGKTYCIERSSNLTPGQWTTLQQNIQGNGTPQSFTDPAPGTPAKLFYRIGVEED